jgi:hypothetical protein
MWFFNPPPTEINQSDKDRISRMPMTDQTEDLMTRCMPENGTAKYINMVVKDRPITVASAV